MPENYPFRKWKTLSLQLGKIIPISSIAGRNATGEFRIDITVFALYAVEKLNPPITRAVKKKVIFRYGAFTL